MVVTSPRYGLQLYREMESEGPNRYELSSRSLLAFRLAAHLASFCNNFFYRVWLTFARGNEVAQTTGYVRAPCVRTNTVALIRRHEPNVRKVNFCFVTLLGNFKDNICALPLALVLNKVKVVVQNMPNDFLARHEFGDFECTTVNVLVVVIKHSAEFVGVALNSL